jgi:hypothetical protein
MRQAPALLTVLGALASCQTAQPPAHASLVDTREAMVARVNPAVAVIWDITNEALGEGGELDPALMDDAAWTRLREAAQKLEAASRTMADADVIRAGGPNLVDGKVPEGAASRAEIQAMIDADPAGFRAEARDLAERARLLVDAARGRDGAAAGHRAAEINEPCQSCHTRYWYKQDSPQPGEGRPSA